MFDRSAHEARIRWFREARFGMFIHWGLYAIPARGEWVRSNERMPESEYLPYFERFTAPDFDAKRWAKACRSAGMKYAVLTAKHHDGFCLFDSKYTDFKSTNTPFGRDAVREFVDAFRAEGIRVGLYYSLLDWHHPDYPHAEDRIHPDRGRVSDEGRDFGRYLDYMHAQVRELCENYGKIDIFWFDYSYPGMTGETWRATELVNMVRTLQPEAILDNRLEASGEGFGTLITDAPSAYCGDFVCPEHIIPPEGIVDARGREVMWETCETINNHWGYCARDRFYKPASMIIRKLVECVSKGGNFLLNVGPDARGNMAPEAIAILQEVGEWLSLNGESVYGCGRCDLPKPDFGRLTAGHGAIYHHILDMPLGYIPLSGAAEASRATLLATGAEVDISGNWITNNYPGMIFASLGEDPVPPDARDTVIKVEA